jgi:hypothetical protein
MGVKVAVFRPPMIAHRPPGVKIAPPVRPSAVGGIPERFLR